MFIFLRLLLAHFIADFPLQFDAIYKLKNRGLIGIAPHALIVAGCCALLSWPHWDKPMLWVFILMIGCTHLLQDSIKLSYSSIKHGFWAYTIDQLSHAATIGLIFFTNLKYLEPPLASSAWVSLYNNDLVIAYLIAMIAATYNGFFMIRSFKSTFLGRAGRYKPFEKWYGMFERALIVTVFLVQRYTFVWLVVVMLLRPLAYLAVRKVLPLHKNFLSRQDMLLSWTMAMLSGFALYLFQSCYAVY